MNKLAIKVDDLTVAYQQKPVLWDVDWQVPTGVLMGIVGPNGAGKSTLIKSVLGLIKPLAGTVEILGEKGKSKRKKVAYVPQRNSVDWDFPTTVLDVVTMGTYGELGWFKRPGKKEKEKAQAALEKVSLLDLQNRHISQLSGGQQQRVFLARALAQKAQVYLMDEPFQGVDATTESAIIQLMKNLKEEGKTVVVVHHDLDTVPEYFDWVTLLNIRINACGPVEEVFNLANLKKTYGDKQFINYKLLK